MSINLNLEVWYSCRTPYHGYLCFKHAVYLASIGSDIQADVTEVGQEGDMRSTICKLCYP